jgi:four helix bundle protein
MSEGNKNYSYKDLVVWQKAMDLVVLVYEITEAFPKSEMYGLTSQIRRSAVSIPSNIAEGKRRGSKDEYRRFLQISYASGAELETQLEIVKRISFGKHLDIENIDLMLSDIMKMLNKLIMVVKERF